jgi:hypothetical protein
LGTCLHSCLIFFPHPSLEIGICTAYSLTSFIYNYKFLLCYFYSFPFPSVKQAPSLFYTSTRFHFSSFDISKLRRAKGAEIFLACNFDSFNHMAHMHFCPLITAAMQIVCVNINDFRILANFHILSRTSFFKLGEIFEAGLEILSLRYAIPFSSHRAVLSLTPSH